MKWIQRCPRVALDPPWVRTCDLELVGQSSHSDEQCAFRRKISPLESLRRESSLSLWSSDSEQSLRKIPLSCLSLYWIYRGNSSREFLKRSIHVKITLRPWSVIWELFSEKEAFLLVQPGNQLDRESCDITWRSRWSFFINNSYFVKLYIGSVTEFLWRWNATTSSFFSFTLNLKSY